MVCEGVCVCVCDRDCKYSMSHIRVCDGVLDDLLSPSHCQETVAWETDDPSHLCVRNCLHLV